MFQQKKYMNFTLGGNVFCDGDIFSTITFLKPCRSYKPSCPHIEMCLIALAVEIILEEDQDL